MPVLVEVVNLIISDGGILVSAGIGGAVEPHSLKVFLTKPILKLY